MPPYSNPPRRPGPHTNFSFPGQGTRLGHTVREGCVSSGKPQIIHQTRAHPAPSSAVVQYIRPGSSGSGSGSTTGSKKFSHSVAHTKRGPYGQTNYDSGPESSAAGKRPSSAGVASAVSGGSGGRGSRSGARGFFGSLGRSASALASSAASGKGKSKAAVAPAARPGMKRDEMAVRMKMEERVVPRKFS